MRLCVMGTGYVGLVAAACFSDTGNHVVGYDVDENKIEKLNKEILPIYEPGLEEIVSRNMKSGRLKFTTDQSAIKESSVIFVAVGTPQNEDGSSNLTYLKEAVDKISKEISHDTYVVLKSTVPVGTSDMVEDMLKNSKAKVEVISNPEFLKEGTALNDFIRPERVIIGCKSDSARRIMADLYAPFVRSGSPILFMSNRSAELSKYAANCFLAMKISFINEIAFLSEAVNADIHDVRRALISDSRIGNKFLYPGCGYGGSCFPKDVLAIIHLGKEYGLEMPIFRATHEINERQKKLIFEKIKRHFDNKLENKTFSIWGLSFKPETDDMREAPSVTLINSLLRAGSIVKAYDPASLNEAKRIFDRKIEIYTDAYETLYGSDGLVILTEWNEFRTPDFDLIKRALRNKVIFDGRNLYNPESMHHLGIKYYCIGKRTL